MSRRLPMWRSLIGTPDMASCREVARVLQAYLDGEVDEGTTSRVRRHLEVCRRCGLEATTYAEIKRAIEHRRELVPDDARERLRRFAEELMHEPEQHAD